MKATPIKASRAASPAAGAVVLWCVLASGLVASLLMLEPPAGRGLEFWNPAGAFRLLADLTVFYCVFILPVLPRREKRSLSAVLESLGIVLYTAVLGLIMVNYLVGQDAAAMLRIVLFLVLVSASAALWAETLGERRGVYYSAAALAAFGAPLVRFFMDELLRVEARWLDVVSPFTAWRAIAAPDRLSTGAWAVCLAVFVSGGIAFLIRRRRGAA
jgi:hypothetical protein